MYRLLTSRSQFAWTAGQEMHTVTPSQGSAYSTSTVGVHGHSGSSAMHSEPPLRPQSYRHHRKTSSTSSSGFSRGGLSMTSHSSPSSISVRSHGGFTLSPMEEREEDNFERSRPPSATKVEISSEQRTASLTPRQEIHHYSADTRSSMIPSDRSREEHAPQSLRRSGVQPDSRGYHLRDDTS